MAPLDRVSWGGRDRISNLEETVAGIQSGSGGSLSSILATSTDAGANKITNLADPTSAQDAATEAYVDLASVGSALYLYANFV